ncbi:unnamed protein product [Paramecium octaurelia]|uniref:Uncharacterized protein n=1 Tax=Paramecium octaurelia TaxID=43137 RepID=A0A8S1TVV3_PAROT|nr:unnamed protein product [Paramecium octaurelia]
MLLYLRNLLLHPTRLMKLKSTLQLKDNRCCQSFNEHSNQHQYQSSQGPLSHYSYFSITMPSPKILIQFSFQSVQIQPQHIPLRQSNIIMNMNICIRNIHHRESFFHHHIPHLNLLFNPHNKNRYFFNFLKKFKYLLVLQISRHYLTTSKKFTNLTSF